MTVTASALPAWSTLLGFLDAELAAAVERMARPLDLLMNEDPHQVVGSQDMDGYDGIDRRGALDNLLLTEWLLVDEEPLEFLRRYATHELSYLRREYVTPSTHGRLLLLADAGPDQVGAPRLAHLAGLVVLHRRAQAMGVPLEIGFLGGEPAAYHGGDVPEQLALWRKTRTGRRPTSEQLPPWLDALDRRDRLWLFGAETARAGFGPGMPPGVRGLSARETGWGPSGASELTVEADRRRVVLPMPSSARATALLRGEGFRRRPSLAVEHERGPLLYPTFTGSALRLLCRTDRADELVAVSLGTARGARGGRPRRHRFEGPVLAAGVIGDRIVALFERDGWIDAAVVGRHLGRVDTIHIRASAVGVLPDSIQEPTDLEPIYFSAGRLVVRLSGIYWFIQAPDDVENAGSGTVVQIAASRITDTPRIAIRYGSLVSLGISRVNLPADRRVFFGPLMTAAVETSGNVFTISGIESRPLEIAVARGDRVVGLTATRADGPHLVVQSAGERIIRLIGPQRSRTLTAASGDVVHATLHPTEPILAIQRRGGAIEAFDLPSGEPRALLLATST
jgi:hypothetical protein